MTTENKIEDSKKEEFPKEGQHLVKTKTGFIRLNRKQFRARRVKNTMATKKNYAYQVKENGFKHIVNKTPFYPSHPPSMTNKMRHKSRQINRDMLNRQRTTLT